MQKTQAFQFEHPEGGGGDALSGRLVPVRALERLLPKPGLRADDEPDPGVDPARRGFLVAAACGGLQGGLIGGLSRGLPKSLAAAAALLPAMGMVPAYARPALDAGAVDLMQGGALLGQQESFGGLGVAPNAGSSAFSNDYFGPAPSFSSPQFWASPRWIWLRRPDTGEQFKEIYWQNGQIEPAGYQRLCWALRDVHLDKRLKQIASSQYGISSVPASWYSDSRFAPAVQMSIVLLDILYAFSGWLQWAGVSRPLHISAGGGFRHSSTNAKTEGAARNSAHLRGGAADIILPGIDVNSVGRFALWLRGGGVGFYPSRGFVHVDDGNLRAWRG